MLFHLLRQQVVRHHRTLWSRLPIQTKFGSPGRALLLINIKALAHAIC